jgi:hypothetical protein
MVNYMQKVNEWILLECIHLLSACNYHDGLERELGGES